MNKDTPTVRGIMAQVAHLNIGDRGVLLADLAEFTTRGLVEMVGLDVAKQGVSTSVQVGLDRVNAPDQPIN